MKIYKYPVEVGKLNTLQLPADAKIVHVGNQGRQDVVFIWAEFDRKMTEFRMFNVFGTGEEIPPDAYFYVGTTEVTPNLVWHVYELVR